MDCSLRCTSGRSARSPSTWTRRRKSGRRGSLKSYATGWRAPNISCTKTGFRIASRCLGNYGTDLVLKREINRFLISEDPYGTVSFVRFGVERHELRDDLDLEMMVSIIDWMVERFQDALLTAELDPGLFRRQGELAEKKEARIQQFLAVLQRAIGAVPANSTNGRTRARGDRRR